MIKSTGFSDVLKGALEGGKEEVGGRESRWGGEMRSRWLRFVHPGDLEGQCVP